MKDVPVCVLIPVKLTSTEFLPYSKFALKSWSLDVPTKKLDFKCYLSTNKSICKSTCVFSSTKFTPEKLLPRKYHLKRTSWTLVLRLKTDSFKLRDNSLYELFRYLNKWFFKTSFLQIKPKSQLTKSWQTRFVWWENCQFFPRVCNLIFQKTQKIESSYTSFVSETKVDRYIVFISKNGLSFWDFKPVNVNWSKFRWNVLFLRWTSGVSRCRTNITNVKFSQNQTLLSSKLPVCSRVTQGHNRLVCTSRGVMD